MSNFLHLPFVFERKSDLVSQTRTKKKVKYYFVAERILAQAANALLPVLCYYFKKHNLH